MANQDFFLSPDDAQTLGDINYMRKSVRVRHTFPKTLKNPNGFETVVEVSASDGRSLNGINNSVNTTSTFQPAQNTSTTPDPQPIKTTPKARPQGSSMDMFRNMARNIGKK